MFSVTRPMRMTVLGSTALFLIAAAAVANLAPEDAEPAGPVIAAPQAATSLWEYKALPRREVVNLAPGDQGEYILPEDLLEDFNRGLEVLGEQGWELVAVEPYHTEGYVRWPALYVFRRPK